MRPVARPLRTNPTFVQRVGTAQGLQPHRVRTVQRSRDPHVQDTLEDVLGLYLHPPEQAVVLGVEENSQIHARDRTPPGLPLTPGRCGTLTHEYTRQGPPCSLPPGMSRRAPSSPPACRALGLRNGCGAVV